MPKQELLGEVKKLINLGKEKGFLTYDDLNSTLPADVVSSDQFSTIMTMFGEMDIEIVESAETERTPKAAEGEEAIEESEESDSSEENEKEIDLTPGALSRGSHLDGVRHASLLGSVAPYRFYRLGRAPAGDWSTTPSIRSVRCGSRTCTACTNPRHGLPKRPRTTNANPSPSSPASTPRDV